MNKETKVNNIEPLEVITEEAIVIDSEDIKEVSETDVVEIKENENSIKDTICIKESSPAIKEYKEQNSKRMNRQEAMKIIKERKAKKSKQLT